ncbi:MAG: hypothetical protein Kow0079_06610 [Vicingaceae bacterium]
MAKNKLIAVLILVVIFLLPFQYAYNEFTTESAVLQVFCMTITIIGSIYAILLFNKGSNQNSL